MTPRRPDILGLPPDGLAYALRGAARAVAAVRAGSALPQALDAAFASSRPAPTPQSRGAIQDIAYRTMRRFGTAQALLPLLTAKPPAPPLAALLCCALALLDGIEGELAYEPFTVVDQAVDAAAGDPATLPARNMVNAVLRRFLRERDALVERIGASPQARWNYPAWWIDETRRAWPNDWEAILAAGNQPPPLTLRVNQRRLDVDAALRLLAGAGIGARAVGPVAIRLDRPLPVAKIPGFADGLFSVQDAAAQRAAPLLDVADGMRVLDACAAPGGKTGHLLECADLDLTALDADPKRLARVDDNLRRLGLLDANVRLVTGDAASHATAAAGGWWDARPFDRILADVPCTASGIVRRHPDIRWLRRRNDAAALAAISSRILDNLWQMLRPDGKLLLVTCSLWPQESALQADAFAARTGAQRLPAPGQLLPHAGADDDHDGLFFALFVKPA